MNRSHNPMSHHKLIMPEHLNPDGFLFGGYLLQWIDEVAYMTALLDFPGHRLVTVAMDNVVFKRHILKGEVVRFDVSRVKLGNSSVDYRVGVYGEVKNPDPREILFETTITFVCVDKKGNKGRISESCRVNN